MSFCLGLPLPLFPSIFPSIISLCRELPRKMCPIQFFCLVLIIFIKDLFSSPFFNTSSFVLCSVQLILYPPPYPHLKSFYPFHILLSHRPCLHSIQCDAPCQCFSHSFLDVSILA